MTKYVEIPETGIGDLSDGYHTFNQLYYQRMILFAQIVNDHKDKAWKTRRHEDSELCFGGGWFLVTIDTPNGAYGYHYEDQYWDLFDCKELPKAKHWDGYTEKDVTRLFSLTESEEDGKWIRTGEDGYCSVCHGDMPIFIEDWSYEYAETQYCPHCGIRMDLKKDSIHEAIKKILAEPPRTFTKEEAHELLMHLDVVDESGEVREPFKDIFVKKK